MHGFIEGHGELMTARQASAWASGFLQKNVTPSNIIYLTRYGRVRNHGKSTSVLVSQVELETYFRQRHDIESNWKARLGSDLNWTLSFSQYKEAETTKHVHRLHPYKGKFIPQLVEYFIDSHLDKFKRQVFFQPHDIILDPFCGSGTTLVECSEKGIHGIGIEVSQFNAKISNAKIGFYDLIHLKSAARAVSEALSHFNEKARIHEFEEALLDSLRVFNTRYFSDEDRSRTRQSTSEACAYGEKRARQFQPRFDELVRQFSVPLFEHKKQEDNFIASWFHPHIIKELDIIKKCIRQSPRELLDILSIMLCRVARSSRATTHSDLATLSRPVRSPYYCHKHGKVCKPLFSAQKWWERYSLDTIKRLGQFARLRGDTVQHCFWGDSANMDIEDMLGRESARSASVARLARLYREQKIKGIFSSPPYVGLIDYHEQHAYAYELLGLPRVDGQEIGRACRGQGRAAKQDYVEGVAAVLENCKRFMVSDYHVFLVANDKFDLYPTIAERAGMRIINQYKRPVLNRSEKDRAAYSEFIFHMRAQ